MLCYMLRAADGIAPMYRVVDFVVPGYARASVAATSDRHTMEFLLLRRASTSNAEPDVQPLLELPVVVLQDGKGAN
jgi:hypothetical protein